MDHDVPGAVVVGEGSRVPPVLWECEFGKGWALAAIAHTRSYLYPWLRAGSLSSLSQPRPCPPAYQLRRRGSCRTIYTEAVNPAALELKDWHHPHTLRPILLTAGDEQPCKVAPTAVTLVPRALGQPPRLQLSSPGPGRTR